MTILTPQSTKEQVGQALAECHWLTIRHIAQMLAIPTPLFEPVPGLDAQILDRFDIDPSHVFTAYATMVELRKTRVAIFEQVFPIIIKAIIGGFRAKNWDDVVNLTYNTINSL